MRLIKIAKHVFPLSTHELSKTTFLKNNLVTYEFDFKSFVAISRITRLEKFYSDINQKNM